MAKRALLIGINRYRIPGADLRGCVNDVRNMRRLLVSVYGFERADISVITDYDATKSAIEKAVGRLVVSGRRGDVMIMHYSGHGSNVPDDNGDEADRRDEILCPTDLDWREPLRDDWLRKQFDGLRAGVSLTVVMDCCHSGTVTRRLPAADAPSMERYLPSPKDILAVESARRLRGRIERGLRVSRHAARKRSDVVNAEIPEMLITGCRETQTSADAMIEGSYNGALTYALATVVRKAKGRLTYRELHRGTAAWLRRKSFDQVPQLEGRENRFDDPFLAPLAG